MEKEVKITRKDALLTELAMIEAIEKWPERVKALTISEAQFCEKYGFPNAAFNKNKNLVRIPSKEKYADIEAAFQSEGV